jgi:ElaB/YqjD/DUF883 family membrane-anchored ribosome-binding protein
MASPNRAAADAADAVSDVEGRIATELHRLRVELDTLLDRAGPEVSRIARQAGDSAQAQLDDLAGHVRARPLGAVLAAAAVGYVLGRLTR